MNSFFKLLALTSLLACFSACEDLTPIDARRGSETEPPQVIQTAFWELPQKIAGITYSSSKSGTTGVTGIEGLITCTEGETVNFSVGTVPIGSAVCSKSISLAEIAGEPNSQSPRAVQLLLFLLSLDDDNNSNNGITLVDSAVNYRGGDVFDLDNPTNIAALIQTLNPGTPVIDLAGVEQLIEAVGGGNANIIVTRLLGLPLTGLEYTNATGFRNFTDLTGRITCLEGELLRFSVGSIQIGSALCSKNMSLEDLTDSSEAAVQLTLFLMSLDNDNDSSNGILIADSATNYDGNASIDFSNPLGLEDLIQTLNPGAPIIDTDTAGEFLNNNPASGPLPININVDGLAVAGLIYVNSNGDSQTTQENGQILCQLGETIRLYIGTVFIGEARCSKGLRLEDIVGSEERALQLLVLFISLDNDNNSSNGIELIGAATNYTGDTSVDFNNLEAVQNLIDDIRPNATEENAADLLETVENNTNKVGVRINGFTISGLTYTLPDGTSVVTDSSGLIFCTPGELVSFSIGSLEVGSGICSAGLGLEEIAGDDNQAVQLLLILMSLDLDGDSENGIDLVSAAEDYDGNTVVNLNDPVAVQNIINDIHLSAPTLTDEQAETLLNTIEANSFLLNILIDGFVVEGLTYSLSNGQVFTTESDGFITCTTNETLTFSIGSLILGTAPCSSSLSFQDIAGSEAEALQLLLILMSLDEDDDSSNGINILDSTLNHSGTTTIDLSNTSAVQSLIDELKPSVISADAEDLLDDISNNSDPIAIVLDGLALEGLSYTSISGERLTTDHTGTINCIPDQTLVFSIGSVELESALCSTNLSLRGLAGNSTAATQLSLLFLALDSDSDSSNGITFVDSAVKYNGSATVDLNSAVSVQNLIDLFNPDSTEVSEEDAEDFLFITEDSLDPQNEINLKVAGAVFSGISYRRAGGSISKTDSDGNIVCKFGENIRYSLGLLHIGSFKCNFNPSIINIAGNPNRAIQLLILLMSLDENLDTSDGIQIIPSAQDYNGFAYGSVFFNSVELADLIEDLRPGVTAATEAEARNYLESLGTLNLLISNTVIEGLTFGTSLKGPGLTDSTGLINCINDDFINLKIGTVNIGFLRCRSKTSFIDVAGDFDEAFNLIKILLSFDKDYDATNGIELISDAENFSGVFDLDLSDETTVDDFIELVRPDAEFVPNEQIATLLDNILFSGQISAEDIDRTEGDCPSGSASFTKNSDGSFNFDMPSVTNTLDITSLIDDAVEVVDPQTQLSTITFPIEDEEGEYNILNCNVGGGYSNRVEIKFEDLPLNSTGSEVEESVFKIYQVCNNGLERIFCQGKFRFN